ncbi:PP2C family protein-serine/threonine phosphatase [Streptacidiphilus jiangxiensis]|uniref:Serine phosphatase RsbU, regulator of sigma subunit n=1 Tax=Streptacidiphilus jiangxiensis TaxID=235985 RepID=A0A1H7NQK1_STRJI|nr:PP2C family protein-serine/threonine phosphatase [Streptacidiphilus jiangxiensis]SEL25549.1 Serine phosphatase RsbU, regulator of sigma subunit [Streptacidiphilus jiangxiensis]
MRLGRRRSGARRRYRSAVAFAVVAAALVAGAVAYGAYRLDQRHSAAMHRLAGPWRIAGTSLAQVRTAADDARVVCLFGDGRGGQPPADILQRLKEGLAGLDRSTSDSGTLSQAAGTLGMDAARWIGATQPGTGFDAVRMCGDQSPPTTSTSSTGAGADPVTYAVVRADAARVDDLLQQQVTADGHLAQRSAAASLLYIVGFCVGLLVLAALGAVLFARRVVLPVAVVAEQLTRAGGPLAAQDPRAPRGWIARLTHAAERARATLEHTQRDARRGNEALTQVGPVVQGLHDVLTACGHPGTGVTIATDLVAAEGLIAGDYLGALAAPDGSTALFLGDVSGHGVAAGLLAVQLKSVVGTALRAGLGPASATRAALHAIAYQEERFTTLVVAVVDPAADTLTYVNAGHEEPFLRRSDGTVDRLEPTGPLIHPALDLDRDAWTVRTVPFGPGELLVLCTDGLVEARDAAGREVGDARVAEALTALRPPVPEAAVTALRTMADGFAIDWQRDDITVVAAARTDKPPRPPGDR